MGFLTAPGVREADPEHLIETSGLAPEKFRGHFFNWYDTQTLKPMNGPSFVSSVDSGNLVASLYTLHAGALDLIERPLCSPQLFNGIRAHWALMHTQGKLQ